MNLPEAFLDNLHKTFEAGQMQEEWDAFLLALDEKKWHRAWRVQKANISETKAAELLAKNLLNDSSLAHTFLKAVPWSTDGFYIPNDERPALSILYSLGLIYIQEASAMLPAEALDVKLGERVLDLCAAPGGKSSQSAAKLNGEGVLIANDISESRARVLQRNLEQQGLRNTFVISADPAKDLPREWEGSFDAVQLDAPCSGEGMFRRDPASITSWETYGPQSIRKVQEELLEVSARLLKANGRLVYSTCTFNTYENEELISEFLAKHEDFYIDDMPEHVLAAEGLRPGLHFGKIHADLVKARRIWPQDGLGEGHFCVLLKKRANTLVSDEVEKVFDFSTKVLNEERWTQPSTSALESLENLANSISTASSSNLFAMEGSKHRSPKSNANTRLTKKDRKNKQSTTSEYPSAKEAENAVREFIENYVKKEFHATLYSKTLRSFRTWAYLLPNNIPVLDSIKILKSGCFLGELKRNKNSYKLLASHMWLLESPSDQWKYCINWDLDDERISEILKGQTIQMNEQEQEALSDLTNGSYVALLLEGYPLTWLKKQSSTFKNLYPASWVR